MKTSYLIITSAVAAFFLTIGFTRIAGSFDPLCHGQQVSANATQASPNCTSPCPFPQDRFVA